MTDNKLSSCFKGKVCSFWDTWDWKNYDFFSPKQSALLPLVRQSDSPTQNSLNWLSQYCCWRAGQDTQQIAIFCTTVVVFTFLWRIIWRLDYYSILCLLNSITLKKIKITDNKLSLCYKDELYLTTSSTNMIAYIFFFKQVPQKHSSAIGQTFR